MLLLWICRVTLQQRIGSLQFKKKKKLLYYVALQSSPIDLAATSSNR